MKNIPQRNVLFVDDDTLLLDMVKITYSNKWNVLTAKNSEECFEVLDKYDIDVVLCDYIMPDLDGITLLYYIKIKHPNIRRILFSGKLDLEAILDSINEANVHVVIRKPWENDKFIKTVQEQIINFRKKEEQTFEYENLKLQINNYEQNDSQILEMLTEITESSQISDFTNQFINIIDGIRSLCILNTDLYFEKLESQYLENIFSYLSDIEVFAIQYDQKVMQMYINFLRSNFCLFSGNFEMAMSKYKETLALLSWLSSEFLEPQFIDSIKKFPLFEDYEFNPLFNKSDFLKNIKPNLMKEIQDILKYDLGDIISISESLFSQFQANKSAIQFIIIVKEELPIYEYKGNTIDRFNVGLISGFVVALSHFIKEVISGSGDINTIKHDKGVILFHKIESIKYVILAASDDARYRIGLRQFANETKELIRQIPASNLPNDYEIAEIDRKVQKIFKLSNS